MKAGLIWVIAVFLIIVTAPSFILAHDQLEKPLTPSQMEEAKMLLTDLSDPGAVEIGEALITPESPLYFLKMLRERVEVYFSSSDQVILNRQVEFALRRLREVNALAKKNSPDLIPTTVEKYKYHLDEVSKMPKTDETDQVRAGESVARHLYVLQRIYDSLGNPRAKQAVLSAMERAETFSQELLEDLSQESKEELVQKVALRQAAACSFFLRESTSSALNEVEKYEVGKKVERCQRSLINHLKNQLLEIKRTDLN